MIFVTAYMGGPHGTAKSARDFLRAMTASLSSVHVVSPVSETFPAVVCGRKLATPKWINLPQHRTVLSWYLSLLVPSLGGYLKRRKLPPVLRGKTVIVNGWASYTYWKGMDSLLTGRRYLIVRESPRHFTGVDRDTDLADLLKGLASFHGLIFVSEAARREWLAFRELGGKEAYYLPNCCEEEEVERVLGSDKKSTRSVLGISEDEFLVICPGTVEYRKGQELLLGVVVELARRIERLRVLFVGDAVTHWGEELVQEIKRGPASRWCTYLQGRPEILDLLHASDVLAFPSRAEGMPRTVLEAMALGVPIVASSVDGVPELVENGKSAILIPSGSKEGLRDGLLQLVTDAAFSRRLALEARDRYWRFFCRERQFSRVAKILSAIEKKST